MSENAQAIVTETYLNKLFNDKCALADRSLVELAVYNILTDQVNNPGITLFDGESATPEELFVKLDTLGWISERLEDWWNAHMEEEG